MYFFLHLEFQNSIFIVIFSWNVTSHVILKCSIYPFCCLFLALLITWQCFSYISVFTTIYLCEVVYINFTVHFSCNLSFTLNNHYNDHNTFKFFIFTISDFLLLKMYFFSFNTNIISILSLHSLPAVLIHLKMTRFFFLFCKN